MVNFERLSQAIISFIESEIIPSMTTGQEILARVAIAWLLDSGNIAVDLIAQYPWAKAFGIVDSNKNINADRALMYLRGIAQKKKIEFTLPVFGHFVFGPEDVEKIQALLKEA